jgi:hypothetical protein
MRLESGIREKPITDLKHCGPGTYYGNILNSFWWIKKLFIWHQIFFFK